MKIVLFTPTSDKSAIGRVSCLVERALLDRNHTVDIVCSESNLRTSDPSHPFESHETFWRDTDQVEKLTDEADIILYQIGNSFNFHEGVIHWLYKKPGVAIFHDFYLGHMFYEWAGKHADQAAQILKAWYGDEVADQYFTFSSGEDLLDYSLSRAPMTEWLAAYASGVITHSDWDVARLASACPGPVTVAPLPYDFTQSADGHQQLARAHNEDFHLLAVGHVNSNKLTDDVIRAIGESERLRQTVVFTVMGKIEDHVALQLSELAKEYSVRVEITGEVDRSILDESFHSAHAVTCLRWPNLESASASAIEAMLHGKAIICLDTGFYKMIPDDCCVKIDYNDLIRSMARGLESFLEDDALRLSYADRAAKWSQDEFRADKYASSIEQMVEASIRSALFTKTLEDLVLMDHIKLAGLWAPLTDKDLDSLRIFGTSKD